MLSLETVAKFVNQMNLKWRIDNHPGSPKGLIAYNYIPH